LINIVSAQQASMSRRGRKTRQQDLQEQEQEQSVSYEEDEMNKSLWYTPKMGEEEHELCEYTNVDRLIDLTKDSQQSLMLAMFLCLLYIGILHFIVIMYTLFVRST